MFELIDQVWGLLAILGTIVISAVWVRNRLAKQNYEEMQNLVDTRGKRVDDLEKANAAHEARIIGLEAKIEGILEIKEDRIAEGVVEKLLPFLQDR